MGLFSKFRKNREEEAETNEDYGQESEKTYDVRNMPRAEKEAALRALDKVISTASSGLTVSSVKATRSRFTESGELNERDYKNVTNALASLMIADYSSLGESERATIQSAIDYLVELDEEQEAKQGGMNAANMAVRGMKKR